jgi:hypothetical protein
LKKEAVLQHGIGYRIQEFNPKNVLPHKNSRMTAFITCKTAAQIGDTDAWLWVAT